MNQERANDDNGGDDDNHPPITNPKDDVDMNNQGEFSQIVVDKGTENEIGSRGGEEQPTNNHQGKKRFTIIFFYESILF
jgi:hypothetical protein